MGIAVSLRGIAFRTAVSDSALTYANHPAVQSIVGRVDLVATPSGVQGLRKLLAWPSAHHASEHGGGGSGGGGGNGEDKAKCPFEALLRLGGFA